MEYSINTNYLSIIAGTSNTYNKAYTEAANDVEKNTSKGLSYLKNFLQSIEEISEKDAVKDERISKSKGNIRNFGGIKNIDFALDFLNKHLSNVPAAKDCSAMYDALVKFQPQYTEAYDKKNKIVMYEYESAVYMLVTSLSMILANNMEVVSNGAEIRIKQKSDETFGVIPKTMKELLAQMKAPNHKTYLDELNKTFEDMPAGKVTTEGVYVEGINVDLKDVGNVIASSFGLAKKLINNIFGIFRGGKQALAVIRNSIFGIIPLIRSVAYLRYKRKADTILALDQQVVFIANNIEQLEKRTNIDPEKKEKIIKKQKATIEAYNKKAAKLRAQLMETEKDAATAIKQDDANIGQADDDFVLESGVSISEIFSESKKPVIRKVKLDSESRKGLEELINNSDNVISINDLFKDDDESDDEKNKSMNESFNSKKAFTKLLKEKIKDGNTISLKELENLADADTEIDNNKEALVRFNRLTGEPEAINYKGKWIPM